MRLKALALATSEWNLVLASAAASTRPLPLRSAASRQRVRVPGTTVIVAGAAALWGAPVHVDMSEGLVARSATDVTAQYAPQVIRVRQEVEQVQPDQQSDVTVDHAVVHRE